MFSRVTHNVEFDRSELFVIGIDQRHVQGNVLLDAGIAKVLTETFAIGLASDPFPKLGQIILAIGVLVIGEQFGVLIDQEVM